MQNDRPTKRCFICIPLDEMIVADLTEWLAEADPPRLRPVTPENMHLTVKFLGDVEDREIPRIIDALREAVADAEPMELEVTGVRCLPNARRPRVLAAALEKPEALGGLFERVEEAMARVGFQREGRAFTPHITIGRFKQRPRRGDPPPPEDPDGPPTGFRADRLILMQSTLEKAGPTYTPLAEFPLE